MVDVDRLIKSLPGHWKVIPVPAEGWGFEWSDDGRDYDQPIFLRKDGLARIYLNDASVPDDCRFAIAWDHHYDGSCTGDFLEAIQEADDYVAEYPLIWNDQTKKYE